MYSCLQILLEHGLEPNERIEIVDNNTSVPVVLELFIGFSPLQIIFLLHNSLTNMQIRTHDKSQETVLGFKRVLVSAAEVLIEYGARVHICSPPMARPHRRCSHSRQPDFQLDHRTDCEIFESLDRKNIALQAWSEAPMLFVNWIAVHKDLLSVSIPDSNLPGGSDINSCSICWKDFKSSSSFVKKVRNVCVLSRRFVCDECSRKGFSDGVMTYHISDGQYNLLKSDVDRRNAADHSLIHPTRSSPQQIVKNDDNTNVEPAEDDSFHLGHTISKIHALLSHEVRHATERLKAMIDDDTRNDGDASYRVSSMESKDDKSDKGFLFDGGISLITGDKARINVIETENALAETRNALNERGDKMVSLVQKTASLKDKAHDFARLSKELRKGKESRGFFF